MKKLLLIIPLLFGIGALFAIPAPKAMAQSGLQFCAGGNVAINAWSGGPAIKTWACDFSNNNFFTVITNQNAKQYSNIEDTGGGFDDGLCIGDLNNNPNDAHSGLVGGCGGSAIGWGGNWGTRLCDNNNGIEFWNAHWNGWLVGSLPDGTSFFNNGPPTCYVFTV